VRTRAGKTLIAELTSQYSNPISSNSNLNCKLSLSPLPNLPPTLFPLFIVGLCGPSKTKSRSTGYCSSLRILKNRVLMKGFKPFCGTDLAWKTHRLREHEASHQQRPDHFKVWTHLASIPIRNALYPSLFAFRAFNESRVNGTASAAGCKTCRKDYQCVS
jgi:hypothetical protein